MDKKVRKKMKMNNKVIMNKNKYMMRRNNKLNFSNHKQINKIKGFFNNNHNNGNRSVKKVNK